MLLDSQFRVSGWRFGPGAETSLHLPALARGTVVGSFRSNGTLEESSKRRILNRMSPMYEGTLLAVYPPNPANLQAPQTL